VPADPSSFIPAALTQLAHAAPLGPAEGPQLLAYLATIADPRARCGRRHPLVAILAIAAAAVLTGARSMTAIAEWAADTPQPVRAALGARRDGPDRWVVPTETTIRRTLARVDPTVLAAAIGGWLADRDDRDRHEQRRRGVAVDGKTLRGARRDGRQVHLLAAMDHTTRAVLAQREVDGAPGEVPGFQPLLADLELAGVVVTADALQTHADAAEFLVTVKQADYLFMVKANQPTLLARCAGLPWHRVPVLDRTRDRAHGRVELRTLKAVTVNGFGFPHAAQVIQVSRKTRDLRTRRWRTVVFYAITSLTFAQASPARLADLLRGHWAIENGLHYVRDVTFAEEPLPSPDRHRPAGHGVPAQPGHRRAQPGRAGQLRRRAAPSQPRPTPTPGHPRNHHRMNRTLHTDAGALGRAARDRRPDLVPGVPPSPRPTPYRALLDSPHREGTRT
jgi:predicted transposase YbfD/YdcC